MSTHPIRITVSYGPGRPPDILEGSDERDLGLRAEDLIVKALREGRGVGHEVSARDPQTEKRLRSYLAEAGREQTMMGSRRKASDL